MGSAAETTGSVAPQRNVLILGSGAMACLFAARLAASGAAVTLLGSWPAGLDVLRRNGVCVEENGAEHCYPVQATDDSTKCSGAELALVLVKSWQSQRAAQQLARVLAPTGVALTLQNGLGARETLAQYLGEERAAAGVTTLGATLLAPGRVRPTAGGDILLGAHPGLSPLLALFAQAGLPARVEPDLQSLVWGKLIVNAAINPLTALLRVPNGTLLEQPQARVLLRALTREGEAAAQAAGIRLPYADALAQVELVLRQTAQNRSSMLQDVERGAPTEMEAITGALLEQGRRYGVPMPVHMRVYALLRRMLGEH